jgi:hypothetical protein
MSISVDAHRHYALPCDGTKSFGDKNI